MAQKVDKEVIKQLPNDSVVGSKSKLGSIKCRGNSHYCVTRSCDILIRACRFNTDFHNYCIKKLTVMMIAGFTS
jgi:hypothetical protein